MKARIVAGLFASFVLLAAGSSGAAPKKQRKVKPAPAVTPAAEVTAAAPRKQRKVKAAALVTPAAEVTAGAAPEPATKASPAKAEVKREAAAPASRFISSGVPLAEVKAGRIKAVGGAKQPCGAAKTWAKRGSLWAALDAWGQVIEPQATIVDKRFFEGSGCHAVTMFPAGGSGEAARLFVAAGSGYQAAPSAEWKAGRDQTKRFIELYTAQERAWVEGKRGERGAGARTMFFHLPKQESSVEGAPSTRRPTEWAVGGGRVLVVGYVGAGGAWKVGHVLPPNGRERAYEPIAVLDMNGDGMPEIVVHEDAGGTFTDRVLSFDAGTMRWEKSVESPGGSTP